MKHFAQNSATARERYIILLACSVCVCVCEILWYISHLVTLGRKHRQTVYAFAFGINHKDTCRYDVFVYPYVSMCHNRVDNHNYTMRYTVGD